MKKAAIVILNWNTKDYLRRFVPFVLASLPPAKEVGTSELELIVADSASSDGSMEMMAESFPNVRTLPLDRNYGFTGGYNRALKLLEGEFEYYILLNSDIEVPKSWIEPLLQWMDTHPECGACVPKLHSWYERDSFEYAGAAGGFLDSLGYPLCRGRVMKRVEKDFGQYDKAAREVFWASGACLMVRSKLFHSLGAFDERFFAHMEEIDFCWRLQLEGHTVCVIPESTVYHIGGGTLPNDSPRKLKLNFRNNLLMLGNNLAKSYSLMFFKHGSDAVSAAKKGVAKARKMIFLRKMLDGASACVYLLTLKTDCFKAVLDAHREYKKMSVVENKEEVEAYLQTVLPKTRIHGWYKGWSVMSSLLWGKNIFSHIRDFYV